MMRLKSVAKHTIWVLPVLFFLAQMGFKSSNDQEPKFKLNFTVVGLGSNMGKFLPVLRVEDQHYKMTLEQNSWYFEKDTARMPELVCDGRIRQSSIDSIKDIVIERNDTSISDFSPGTMSGCLYYLSVQFDTVSIKFSLTNCSDTSAAKLLDVVNSNLGENCEKLSLPDPEIFKGVKDYDWGED